MKKQSLLEQRPNKQFLLREMTVWLHSPRTKPEENLTKFQKKFGETDLLPEPSRKI